MAKLNCVVTGANKGIGYEIAKGIAQRAGTRTVLAARNETLGQAALEQLRAELAAAGRQDADLIYRQLGITDSQSVQAFADWARQELRTVDVLVNNAGFAHKGDVFGADECAQTLAVNFHGTAALTEALLPLIPEGGRIINMCSSAGKLRIIPDASLRSKFEQAGSKAALVQLTDSFVDAIRRGRHTQEGYPSSMYGMSKLAEAAYTRVLARELEPRHIMVNAVCPGWCSTDMSSWKGLRSAQQGADTPVWLAFLPAEQFATGKFFSDRKEEPF